MHACTGTCVCVLSSSTHLFIDLHVFTHAGLAHGVIFCQFYRIQWVQSPLAALPSAVAQLGMNLAGHGHSGRWSHPHIEVMKEDSVPHTPHLHPWPQR